MENKKVYPPIFGLKTCMEYAQMSESTIRKYMAKGHPDRIPYWKKGGIVKFDLDKVEKWLRNER